MFNFFQFIHVHCRLTIGLSVSLGLFAIELAGFFGGISMFMPTQGLICILLLKNANILGSLYILILALLVT